MQIVDLLLIISLKKYKNLLTICFFLVLINFNTVNSSLIIGKIVDP